MSFDPRAAVQAAIESGTAPNQTEAKAGGGDYQPPAAGRCRLRLVGYFEIGKQKKTYKGVESFVPKVQLVFELSGKNHQPKEIDGKKYPIRITETMTLSQSDKAAFYKLFKAMNWEGKATHMAQLLGNEFLGEVFHDTWKGQDGKERTSASLRGSAGYSIGKPFVLNPETDEEQRVKVDPALTEIKAFLWNYPSLEMWNSIYIDGEYSEGKSKNVIQNKIMSAQDWEGSPMEQLLSGAGELPIPEAERPAKKAAEPADLDSFDDDDIPF